MQTKNSDLGLSGNVLKVLAAISMVIDHVGVMIFPQNELLRIIGRLAFPIFSYMICEGCKYTRNRLSYLLKILILGIVTTIISSIADGELYFNTLITFSCSISLIFLLTKSRESKNKIRSSLLRLSFLAMAVLFYWFTEKFTVDYGFCGIMLPVFPWVAEAIFSAKKRKLLVFSPSFWAFGIGLALLSLDVGWVQPYCLLSLLLLAFYNGERGFKLPKYSFHVFYPAHIAVIYAISMLK